MNKTIFLFLCFYLFLNREGRGQGNLVPNNSFETYTSCPTGGGQTNLAFPWRDPNNSSSDYYNSCAPDSSNVSVPCQGLTCQYFQPAHSGLGYAGFFACDPSNTALNYREYIQVKLIDSLRSGRCYNVEFYLNLGNHAKFGVNNIGAYISNTAITCPLYTPYNLTPQILLAGNPPIIDTVNWVRIHGVYQANGGEQYLTIGNFAYDSSTTKQIIDTTIFTNNFAYYYVDDVSVIDCSEGINVLSTTNKITISPNPFTSQTTITFSEEQRNTIIKITDVLGNVIKTVILSAARNLTIDKGTMQPGIYFVQITDEKGNTVNRKVVVE